jgi:acyl-CoA dehydrogenase
VPFERNLADEDRAFLSEVRAFLDAELTPELVAAEDAQRNFLGDHHRANAWVDRLKKRRWHVAHWSEEHGGAGLSPLHNYLLLYEQGLRGAPMPRPFGVNYVGPTIMEFGTARQHSAILPPIVDNTVHWCQGFSEPGAGSDLGAVATFAERRGDVYVINGSKIWTTDAQFADRIFCLVRTKREDSKDALSFALVDMDVPGISVQPIRLMTGDHELNQVFFDEVEITPEQFLGPIGGGWAVARYLLEIERGAFVFGGRLRRRFRHLCSRARECGAASRIAGELARLDANLAAYECTELRLGHLRYAHQDSFGAANIIKIEWSELVQRIDELFVDLAGPDALISSKPSASGVYAASGEIGMPGWLASYFNNRATTIYGGSNEIQRNLVYRAMRNAWA